MNTFLEYDGPLFRIMQKLGNMIIINILFLVCCIPVISIGPAVISLYYTMVKCVRHERGYGTQEFLSSMKRIWKKGSLVTLGFMVWGTCLWLGLRQGQNTICFVFALLTIMAGIYLFPVMSRFEMGTVASIKLSFVMSIRYFPITTVLVLGTVIVGYALFFLLPMPCILFVPALWCYVASLGIEKALRGYMKPKEELTEEEKNAWYYEDLTWYKTEKTRQYAEKR